MKTLIIKISLVVATVVLVAVILLVSCSSPVVSTRGELDIAYEYCEPEPASEHATISAQEQTEVQSAPPKPLPMDIVQSPETFLEYIETQNLDEAQKISLTDEFLIALDIYQQEKYDRIYAMRAPPLPVVKDILRFMERTVGGNYIFGGQGDVLTTSLIYKTNRIYPDYMTGGRLEYFVEKAVLQGFEGIDIPAVYPTDYAWDCSGLWWDCVNTLDLFSIYTDKTAAETFEYYSTPITKEELIPGDLVFYRNSTGRISHMGIVGYDGFVYEAASGFVGVVKTQSLDVRIYEDVVRGGHLIFPLWNEFGRPNFYR